MRSRAWRSSKLVSTDAAARKTWASNFFEALPNRHLKMNVRSLKQTEDSKKVIDPAPIHSSPTEPARSPKTQVIRLARIRGFDRTEYSKDAEKCFECKGSLVCDCAICGKSVITENGWEVRPGKCVVCLGTGWLAWSK